MTNDQKRCIYTRLDNGIHEFVFTESSRGAVDELADHIKTILDTTPADAPPTCYLVDNSQAEVVPLIYTRTRIKELDAYRPEGRAPGRLAVVYEGMMGTLANSILALTVKNRIRFFKPSDRDAAMTWLLQEE